jgi:DNA repair exonuclease SbcCD ATPase subunit
VITRVRLSGWRAYERLDLELSRPVVFVVAPNGVGKTSLIEAVRWALLGAAPGAERGRVVRIGAAEAAVELTLDVAGSTVELRRTVDTAGNQTFASRREGADLSEDEFTRLLAEAWAAEAGLLRTLLFGEAGAGTRTAFPLRDHLAEVFGIAPLLAAVATIDGRLKTLGREIRELRAADAVDEDALRAAEADVELLGADVEARAAAEADARRAVDETRAAERVAAAWQSHRDALAGYQQQITILAERLATVVDHVEGEPDAALRGVEEDARDDLDRERAELAEARVEAAAAGAALGQLGDDTAVCPTCLRPLTGDERDLARAHHHDHEDDARGRVLAGQEAVAAAQERLDRVRTITRSLRSLRVPTPPVEPDPGPAAATGARAAQDALLAATKAHGAAVARRDDARAQLDARRRSAREQDALVAAYREEAALEIHRSSLAALADEYLTGRIQPLADEIARRWKLLFGAEGLQLGYDGSMRLRIGAEHLDLADLSGGERVIAFFVTRLLVVASATRATTLWLDEPLEHLDPRRRAAVAATVVRAVQQGALAQVVVTTYEEHLARQLAATAPDLVAVAHVRATPSPR